MNYLSYNGYSALMEYDMDDHILVGKIVGIRDRVVFHGETVAEFEAAFRQSVDDYLANCKALGRDPEKPASGKLMLRIPPQVHAAALAAARASGTSLNQWAANVIYKASGV
ncbi:antitoxin HicB [Betaproteobacteria bacterium]|nr:antitoxin HicB [Betaproteobacteria bacterium]GHU03308.1 antitoxin HicB [Betaproteobacteria bacterium]GHU06794.1 antitoxin HicB [Betaproteobacteria bacterium]GHU18156.1 antitoxin HicB [Betaproteobacteria bacterium]